MSLGEKAVKKIAKTVVSGSMLAEMRKRLPYIELPELTVENLKAEFWKKLTPEMAEQLATYHLGDDDINDILKDITPKLRDLKQGKKVKLGRLPDMLQSLEERVSTKTLETLEEVHVGKMLARDMANQDIKEWDKRRAMSLRGKDH